MGVEVDHRERLAQLRSVGPQQAQRDRVVAAQPGHVVPGDQRLGLRRQRIAHRGQAGVGQRQVAGVAQHAGQIDMEQRMAAVTQHVAGLADGAGAETSAGAVGDGAIPGQPGHAEGMAGGQLWATQKAVLGQEGEAEHGAGLAFGQKVGGVSMHQASRWQCAVPGQVRAVPCQGQGQGQGRFQRKVAAALSHRENTIPPCEIHTCCGAARIFTLPNVVSHHGKYPATC